MRPSPRYGPTLRNRKFYPPAFPERCVGGSIPCIGCGYNLKTLHTHRLCPECGLLVDTSIRWHAANRRAPLRRVHLAAGVALAAFLLLGSVDPAGPLYRSAVVAFAISLLAAGAAVLDQLWRDSGG